MGVPVRNSIIRFQGMTLVELLVAMAITGVILLGVISLTGGVLRYSGQVSTVSRLTTDLNDVLGYMGLKLRGASQFIGGVDTVQINAGGSSFACSTDSADGSCVAAVIPVVNRGSATAEITGYELIAFRVGTALEWPDNPGIPDGWDGPNTPMLFEYRAALSCPGSCSVPPLAPAAVTGSGPALLLSGLLLVDNNGVPFRQFDVATQARVIMRLRVREQTADGLRTVPAAEPLELRIARRQ